MKYDECIQYNFLKVMEIWFSLFVIPIGSVVSLSFDMDSLVLYTYFLIQEKLRNIHVDVHIAILVNTFLHHYFFLLI